MKKYLSSKQIIPEKIKKGDTVRFIASSRSLFILNKEIIKIANKHFKKIGLQITFGEHVDEIDDFSSSSIESRIKDLHDAFNDKCIKAIISIVGGSNCNQLLRYIDWDIIKNNPKIFCGFSDTTALTNAIYTKTGLITYSGPNYYSFGQKLIFYYNLEYFKKCLMSDHFFEIRPSNYWSDDEWCIDQDKKKKIKNEGFLVINEGVAEGIILGSNLCTFNLLQGTEYMPSLKNSILFIEDNYESLSYDVDRNLQSLIHLPDFNGVKGVVFGRFQKKSKITKKLLIKIVKSKKELQNIPVIANVDFGHTEPKITFPIGGTVCIEALKTNSKIKIIVH